MRLFDDAKGELVRHGTVMNTHVLLKRDNTSVCLVEADVDKDAMVCHCQLKAVAPACKAVESTFEAWMADYKDDPAVNVRPSAHPSRVEAIVVSVQSKDGSWFLHIQV